MESEPCKARAEQAGSERDDYQAPELTVLGSFAELTRGNVVTTTDGLNPGSAL